MPLRSSSACAGREARQLAGDEHVLLLVARDAVRVLQDRLQARVGVLDALGVALVGGERRDVLHRPGPVERDERDDVLEARGLHLARGALHALGLQLEHARGVAARDHLEGRDVVERDRRRRRASMPLDCWTNSTTFFSTSRLRRPSTSILSRPSSSTSRLLELRDDLVAVLAGAQRHDARSAGGRRSPRPRRGCRCCAPCPRAASPCRRRERIVASES